MCASGGLAGSPMLLHQFMNGALEAMHPTALQKDTTFTKIFVGGLPYHTNDASLRKYFEAFGDIDEAVVITDRQTGKSRGYGFVSRNEIQQVIQFSPRWNTRAAHRVSLHFLFIYFCRPHTVQGFVVLCAPVHVLMFCPCATTTSMRVDLMPRSWNSNCLPILMRMRDHTS